MYPSEEEIRNERELAETLHQVRVKEIQERFQSDVAETRARTRESFDWWERAFGEKVKGWRRDRNWSQEDLAREMTALGFEMHQTTVAKIERGGRPLRVSEAVALAQVFGVPALAVFYGPGPDLEPWSIAAMREHLERLDESVRDAQARLEEQAKDLAFWEASRTVAADMLNRSAKAAEQNDAP